jgi:hypothetical protein
MIQVGRDQRENWQFETHRPPAVLVTRPISAALVGGAALARR